MAANDTYYEVVRVALTNDDWTITDSPLKLTVNDTNVKIDLGAEKLLTAEREGRKIAVEIKSFLNASPLYDFHLALGQYLNYQYALDIRDPERKLYLAIPVDAYENFFIGRFAQEIVQRHGLNYFVFDPETKVIERWEN
ncbi:MAG: element excision factor XisH family protein [Chloroflexota bacterium]